MPIKLVWKRSKLGSFWTCGTKEDNRSSEKRIAFVIEKNKTGLGNYKLRRFSNPDVLYTGTLGSCKKEALKFFVAGISEGLAVASQVKTAQQTRINDLASDVYNFVFNLLDNGAVSLGVTTDDAGKIAHAIEELFRARLFRSHVEELL